MSIQLHSRQIDLSEYVVSNKESSGDLIIKDRFTAKPLVVLQERKWFGWLSWFFGFSVKLGYPTIGALTSYFTSTKIQ